jgi:hypothetical protein
MKRKMTGLATGIGLALALVLTIPAMAQDQARDDQTRKDQPQQRNDQIRQDNPQQRNDPSRQDEASQNQPAGTSASQQARPDPKTRPDTESTGTSAEYSAELKKCDRFSGNEKTQCLETTMKKFGQM